MSDVFLSYSSKDRAAAERVQRTLAGCGYEVFWDQATPPGQDWDAWIRHKLGSSKIVLVLWSKASVASPNVRHEAMIARDARKLVPVMIERLSPGDFPMGLYLVQGLDLTGWNGDPNSDAAKRLIAEIGARLGKQSASPFAPPPQSVEPTRLNPTSSIAPRVDAPETEYRPEPRRREVMTGLMAAIALSVVTLGVGGYFWWSQQQSAHAASVAWESIDRNDPGALRAFIAAQSGPLKAQAEAALAELEERSYEAASDADTVDALQGFLRDFPESQHALAARGRVAELQAPPPTRQTNPDLIPPTSSGGPVQLTPPSP